MSDTKKSADIQEMMGRADVNKMSLSTSLLGLDIESFGRLFGELTEVHCPDKSSAFILKNPGKAFETYAKEWSAKVKVVADVLDKVKASADADVSSKIVSIFENLNYVEASLREMYKNAYLTYLGDPCGKESQEAKRNADKVISFAAMYLLTIKIYAENQKLDDVNKELLKMLDEIRQTMLPRPAGK
jgi:hypothetical protein